MLNGDLKLRIGGKIFPLDEIVKLIDELLSDEYECKAHQTMANLVPEDFIDD